MTNDVIIIKSIVGPELYRSTTAKTLRDAVINATSAKANLRGANLYEANLYEANLCGADLREANLCGADLYEADLYGANLCEADLRGADLRGANLYEANLCGANLCGANLYEANLCGANLYEANLCGADLYGADLREADLCGANLRGADLRGADLRGADLREADLREADLYEANLCGADLYGADLREADLCGAKGLIPEHITPLLILKDQPGLIRAYKLVKPNGEGPYNGGIIYEVGKSYEVANANTDPNQQCGAGINLATLDWCLREYKEGYKIFIADFTAADIAAIPTGTDGKFRVHRCTIAGEKDLAGLIPAEK